MRIFPGSTRGFSLLEMIIAAMISVVVFMGVMYTSTLACRQISLYVERYNMYSQLELALQDMQARLPAAVKVTTPLDAGDPHDVRTAAQGFRFQAENDIFTVTPDALSDNAWYTYEIDQATGGLVLRKEYGSLPVQSIVLIEGMFRPEVTFGWEDEPNFLKVIVKASSRKKNLAGLPQNITKVEGIRLWFVNAVQ